MEDPKPRTPAPTPSSRTRTHAETLPAPTTDPLQRTRSTSQKSRKLQAKAAPNSLPPPDRKGKGPLLEEAPQTLPSSESSQSESLMHDCRSDDHLSPHVAREQGEEGSAESSLGAGPSRLPLPGTSSHPHKQGPKSPKVGFLAPPTEMISADEFAAMALELQEDFDKPTRKDVKLEGDEERQEESRLDTGLRTLLFLVPWSIRAPIAVVKRGVMQHLGSQLSDDEVGALRIITPHTQVKDWPANNECILVEFQSREAAERFVPSRCQDRKIPIPISTLRREEKFIHLQIKRLSEWEDEKIASLAKEGEIACTFSNLPHGENWIHELIHLLTRPDARNGFPQGRFADMRMEEYVHPTSQSKNGNIVGLAALHDSEGTLSDNVLGTYWLSSTQPTPTLVHFACRSCYYCGGHHLSNEHTDFHQTRPAGAPSAKSTMAEANNHNSTHSALPSNLVPAALVLPPPYRRTPSPMCLQTHSLPPHHSHLATFPLSLCPCSPIHQEEARNDGQAGPADPNRCRGHLLHILRLPPRGLELPALRLWAPQQLEISQGRRSCPGREKEDSYGYLPSRRCEAHALCPPPEVSGRPASLGSKPRMDPEPFHNPLLSYAGTHHQVGRARTQPQCTPCSSFSPSHLLPTHALPRPATLSHSLAPPWLKTLLTHSSTPWELPGRNPLFQSVALPAESLTVNALLNQTYKLFHGLLDTQHCVNITSVMVSSNLKYGTRQGTPQNSKSADIQTPPFTTPHAHLIGRHVFPLTHRKNYKALHFLATPPQRTLLLRGSGWATTRSLAATPPLPDYAAANRYLHKSTPPYQTNTAAPRSNTQRSPPRQNTLSLSHILLSLSGYTPPKNWDPKNRRHKWKKARTSPKGRTSQPPSILQKLLACFSRRATQAYTCAHTYIIQPCLHALLSALGYISVALVALIPHPLVSFNLFFLQSLPTWNSTLSQMYCNNTTLPPLHLHTALQHTWPLLWHLLRQSTAPLSHLPAHPCSRVHTHHPPHASPPLSTVTPPAEPRPPPQTSPPQPRSRTSHTTIAHPSNLYRNKPRSPTTPLSPPNPHSPPQSTPPATRKKRPLPPFRPWARKRHRSTPQSAVHNETWDIPSQPHRPPLERTNQVDPQSSLQEEENTPLGKPHIHILLAQGLDIHPAGAYIDIHHLLSRYRPDVLLVPNTQRCNQDKANSIGRHLRCTATLAPAKGPNPGGLLILTSNKSVTIHNLRHRVRSNLVSFSLKQGSFSTQLSYISSPADPTSLTYKKFWASKAHALLRPITTPSPHAVLTCHPLHNPPTPGLTGSLLHTLPHLPSGVLRHHNFLPISPPALEERALLYANLSLVNAHPSVVTENPVIRDSTLRTTSLTIPRVQTTPPQNQDCTTICPPPSTRKHQIRIGTLNINSLRPNHKQFMLRTLLEDNNIDLLGLSDARSLHKCKHFQIQKTLNSTVLISPNHSSHTGGVALIIRNQQIKPLSVSHSDDNRALLATLEWKTSTLQVLVVYCPPNQAERTRFLTQDLPTFLKDHDISESCLILGDFNFSHDGILKPTLPIDLAHFTALEDATQGHTLTDIHAHLHPGTHSHTFVTIRGDTFIPSRIDRIYSTPSLSPMISSSTLVQLSPHMTDHSHCPVISLTHSTQPTLGRSYWKLNTSLLDRPSAKSFLSTTLTNSRHLPWHKVKQTLTPFFRKFGQEEKARSVKTYHRMVTEYHALLSDAVRCHTDSRARAKLANLKILIERHHEREKKFKLLHASSKQVDSQHLPLTILSKLLKRRKDGTFINTLQNKHGVPSSDPTTMLSSAAAFYAELYNRPHPDPSHLNPTSPPPQHLTPEAAEALAAEFSDYDIIKAIKDLPKNKVPGPDGIPAELYQAYPEKILPYVRELIHQVFTKNDPPPDLTASITTLIHKKGDKENPANYRPISLLNTDYKILAKLLANRLAAVLPQITSEDQTGFVPGRNIAHTLSELTDIQEWCHRNRHPGLLLSVDFEKAYDTLRRDFLFDSLHKLGLPPAFVHQVTTLHKDTTTKVQINGHLSNPILLSTGVRQGCPLAPLLFICAMELIAHHLRLSHPEGPPIPDCPTKTFFGYADDTTIFLPNQDHLPRALATLAHVATHTGLRINTLKSSIIPLGPLAETSPPTDSPIPWVTMESSVRILGIQFSAALDPKHTWQPILDALPTQLRFWNGVYPSVLSKIAILNNFVSPAFLYHSRIVPPDPATIHTIVDHMKRFLSSHRSHLRENIDKRGLYLFHPQTIFTPKKALGLGTLHPQQRIQAQGAKWIFDLLTPPSLQWKRLALAHLNLPFSTRTFLCHKSILKHLSLPPRWASYFEAFLATNPVIAPTPLTPADIALSPLPFNREILSRTSQPFGGSPREHFLLHQKLTVGALANLVPIPFTSAPPYGWIPPGYSRAQATVLRAIWRAIPPPWKPLIATLSSGTVPLCTPFGIPYNMSDTPDPMLIYKIEALPNNLATGRPWRRTTLIGPYRPCPTSPDLTPTLQRDIIPIHVTDTDTFRGCPLLLALGHRIAYDVSPQASALAKFLPLPLKCADSAPAEDKWAERAPHAFHWHQVARALTSSGIPLKARDTLIRVLFRSIQVNSRVRSSSSESACPRCGTHETIQHCFLQCAPAVEIANGLKSSLGLLFRVDPPEDIPTILFSTAQKERMAIWHSLLAIAFQHIWKHRCNTLDGTITPPPFVLAQQILDDFEIAMRGLLHSLTRSSAKRAPRRLKVYKKLLFYKTGILNTPLPSAPVYAASLSENFRALWPSRPCLVTPPNGSLPAPRTAEVAHRDSDTPQQFVPSVHEPNQGFLPG